MTRLSTVVTWVAGLILFAGCGLPASRAVTDDQQDSETALRRLHDRFVAAHANRDVHEYGQLHTDSVEFWWPAEPSTIGRATLESKMRDNWKNRSGLRLVLTVFERRVHGDRAYEFGSYVESWRDPADAQIMERGRYVMAYVLEKDGEWRITRFVGFGD